MAPALKISTNTDVGQSMIKMNSAAVYKQNISQDKKRCIKSAGIGELPGFHSMPHSLVTSLYILLQACRTKYQ